MKRELEVLMIALAVGLSSQMQQVKIGAIFFIEEVDIESAFTMAVNRMNQRFYDIKIVPIKRYASSDDSIILQKLVCELIGSGVSAIFGPSSKASSDIVALISNDTGIPHISFDWNREESITEKISHSMTINVAPAVSILSKAYADIILNYGWKSFTVVYENDDDLIKLQDVIQIHRLQDEEIKIRKFERSDDYRILWKNIRHNGERRVVLDCSPDIVREVINSSIEFNMTGQFNHLLLTNLDTHSARLYELNSVDFKANITAVRVEVNDYDYLPTSSIKPNLVFDGVQLFAVAIKKMIENQPFQESRMQCDRYRSSEKWLHGQILLDLMKTASTEDGTFITKVMDFNEYGERINFNLEVYRPMVETTMGVWNPVAQLTPNRERPKSTSINQPDYSESRRLYRVAVREGPPYLILKKPKDNEILVGNQKFEGYAVDLIHKLSEINNFDYTIELVDDNAYGSYNPETKEWDGIIRYLIDHKADIGICDLTITQSRKSAVDFTVPFMQLGISILYYKKPPEEKNLFSFLSPFLLEVWLYMATAYLVVSFLFVFMARIARLEWENPHPCNTSPEELENKWSISNTTWLTMGSIMGQGCDILPRSGPMRLVNGMWWFFALMMLNSYTANLAAFLTSSGFKKEITSINDLADQNKIQFGTLSGGSSSFFFKESNDTVYRLAWSKMISAQPTVFTKDNNEGVERVKKNRGTYAYLMETTSLEYSVERNCDLMQIGPQIGEKHYGIAVPIGADYRSNLSVAILKLSEKGELFELKMKWWKNHNVSCVSPEKLDGSELSMQEVGGVFLILVIVLLIAFIIGICEFMWNVQRVAVEQKITPMEAFKSEGMFVLRFWITKKPIRTSDNSSSSLTQSRQSSHSINNVHK